MLSLDWIKAIIMITLLMVTFLFSMLPLKLVRFVTRNQTSHRRITYQNCISLLSCYAAGVFLATCLLDLFPDVKKNLTTAIQIAGVITTYPLPEFVLTFGLFLVFIIEQIVLYAKEIGESDDGSQRRLLDGPGHAYNRLGSSEHGYGTNRLVDTDEPDTCSDRQEHRPHTRGNRYADGEDYLSFQGSLSEDPNTHSSVRSILLVTALSLHSVFEGLAVGLQTNYGKVLQLFAAITLHKSILAFSLGLNLAQSRLTLRGVVQSNLAFSVTSPIGIGIGLAVVDLTPNNYITGLINGILQGLACGTFLYVVFLEILPSEFMNPHSIADRMLMTLAFILGYSTVALLLLLEPGVLQPLLYN